MSSNAGVAPKSKAIRGPFDFESPYATVTDVPIPALDQQLTIRKLHFDEVMMELEA